MSIRYLGALVALMAASPVLAQTNDPATTVPDSPGGRDRVTIALGAGILPSYEGSDNGVVTPVGALNGTVSGFSFFTQGTTFYVDLIPDADGAPGFDFQAGPVAGARFNRASRIRDAQVRALGNRRVAAEVGGFVGISRTGVITSDYDTLSARVSVVHDVAGIHRSTIITPSIAYSTPLSRRTLVGLSASMDFVERGYGRAYFDVDAAGSARSGLPVFRADGGLKSYTLSLLGTQSLSGDLRSGFALFALGSYSRLLNDYSASPVTRIAGSPNQWLGAVGLAYTF